MADEWVDRATRLERDIDRLFANDATGSERRVWKQLRFALQLATHREEPDWIDLVDRAIVEAEALPRHSNPKRSLRTPKPHSPHWPTPHSPIASTTLDMLTST